ncbi:MAG TPA: NAD(P)-dependent oxidoreductase [Syntrophales bacterium]|nr:NAD(P)-dependent oxidoreductase [Syntrophales bacterium]
MEVYFYEVFAEEAEVLRDLLGTRFSWGMTDRTVQEAGHTRPPARLVCIRTQSVVPPAWAGSLDGILSRSTGYDHLLRFRGRISRPLPLGYLEEYATRAVAEHAVTLLVALFKRLPLQIRHFPTFQRDGMTGGEWEGRRLLVVGVGRIGVEVARITSAMGFVVRGVDIVPDKAGVEYVGKEEGIRWAEAVVCAMNLTADNGGYFDYHLLKKARRGLVFVNVARGEHSPLADLERLLREGHLGGLGLDVFEDEEELAVSLRAGRRGDKGTAVVERLLSYPNVLLTPHNAFNTAEALRRKGELTVRQIDHFLRHGDFIWKVP